MGKSYYSGEATYLHYLFGGSPEFIIRWHLSKLFDQVTVSLLSDMYVSSVVLPFLQVLMTFSWLVGFAGLGWCLLVRVLFTLAPKLREQGGGDDDEDDELHRHWKYRRLKLSLELNRERRLSGKCWRKVARMKRCLWIAAMLYNTDEGYGLVGRRYFDRATHTKLERKRWKHIQGYNRALAKVMKKIAISKLSQSKSRVETGELGLEGDYKATYEAYFLRPTVADWSFDWSSTVWKPSIEEEWELDLPIIQKEEDEARLKLPFFQPAPAEVARLVERMDNPTRIVTNFVAMSPADHANNVEAALLRAEIMFNESRSTKWKLRDSVTPMPSDPEFVRLYRDTPCVVDTGASYGLTPFREDFLTYEKCSIKVKAVGAENTVIGMGIALYKMQATNGHDCYVPGIAYHLPNCGVRLLSPQAYHQGYGGHSTIDGEQYTFFFAQAANGPHRHVIRVPIDKRSNLPMIFDVSTTGKDKQNARPYFARSLRMHQHFCGTFFGRWNTTFSLDDDEEEEQWSFAPYLHTTCFDNCVTADINPNLSPGMKELLLWHIRLGISLSHVQYLMNEHERTDEEGNTVQFGAVIPVKHPEARTCDTSMTCATCEIARAKMTKSKTGTKKRDKSADKALTKEKYLPGDFVSMDTVPVGIPGRAYETYGGPNANKVFTHATVFHDAGTGVIKVYLQQDGSADATLYSKEQFERFLWQEAGVVVKHYHSDQGSNFTDATFEADCKEKHQKQSFSGTGAKFANGAAERAVQTLFWKARHFMLHCALRWDLEGCAEPNLWPMALMHAAWLYNRTPRMDTNCSPLEILTFKREDHHDLLRTKVWGCPSFVLDPVLQDGKKLPKFSRRARVGQFMGFSDETSSLVGQIRNLQSGSITNQYHVVYDEKFQSVIGLQAGEHEESLDKYTRLLFEDLFRTDYARDCYVVPEYHDGELVYEVIPLEDEWLTEQEIREKEDRLQQQRLRDAQRRKRYNDQFKPATPTADSKVRLKRKKEKRKRVKFSKDKLATIPASSTVPDVDANELPVSLTPEGGVGNDAASLEGAEGNVDFDTEDSCDDELADSDIEVEDLPGEGEQMWNRRKRRTWKERYADSDYVTNAAFSHDDVTRTQWIQARDFTAEQMASLTLAERAVLRSPKLSRDFGHYELTLMNERQMPCQLSHHPVTRDPIRYPDAHEWMDYSLARQLAREKAQVDLRCNKLEVSSLEDFQKSRLSQFITLSTNNCSYGGSTTEFICQDVHPAFLNAKLGISKADNPGWDEAMSGPEAAEYWKAAEVEIATLEKMKAWEVVDRPPDRPVLPSLWAFKKKRLPSGEVRKYKARFTARGDRQIQDVDFSETWAPVVQWTTVRMMLILATQLNLATYSADVSCAFLHSDIDSEVYVEMPRGFQKEGKVLKLLKSLYGLRQSPRLFWKYLTESMRKCGLEQSHLDPCLFIGEKIVAVAYVDDILFFSKDEADISKLMVDLRDTGLMLEKEDSAAGFLGVDIRATKTDANGKATELELTQCGLIDRIITNLGLDNKDYAKRTPVGSEGPLVKDADGAPCIEAFSYPAVVGQLLYLTGHTRPELAYAVNQCARYMFNPKRSHELALIRIGKYLKATRTKGLVVKPSGGVLNIDAYPDADFAGMYGHEDPADPACVKSRTGFVILVAGCPISWKSTLQSKTALSTMEAEISALAHCMKELVGIMDLAKLFANYYGLEPVETKMNVTLHEDNAGALILANTLPPEYTPRSKFYHIETIWFREQINLRGINVVAVPTKEQLGDIFTKGLSVEAFEYLRLRLCGW